MIFRGFRGKTDQFRCESEIIRRNERKGDPVIFGFGRFVVYRMDVTVICTADAVFFQDFHKFFADVIPEHGRKMEEGDHLRLGMLFLQIPCLRNADFQSDYLPCAYINARLPLIQERCRNISGCFGCVLLYRTVYFFRLLNACRRKRCCGECGYICSVFAHRNYKTQSGIILSEVIYDERT